MNDSPAALSAALHGDLRALGELASQGPLWAKCATLLRSLSAEPSGHDVVLSRSELGGEGSAQLLSLVGLRALLRADQEELVQCIDSFAALLPHAVTRRQRLLAWLHLLRGEGALARALVNELKDRATSERDAEGVVEAHILQAATAMLMGNEAEALDHARRSARMAQSEHLWLSHYLASLVLCRVRRLQGRAHLAARIASACLEVTGPEWHGWLHWERVFAGAPNVPSTLSQDSPSELATLAHRLESWLRQGPTRQGAPALPSGVSSSSFHAADYSAVVRVLDTRASPVADSVGRWIDGQSAGVPGCLSGISTLVRDVGGGGPYVIARPAQPARRSFSLPRGLHRLGPCGSQPTRVDTIIAALCLARRPIERAHLFEEVYGFSYRPAIHEATFKVLRSQAKKHVGALAEFSSEGGYHVRILQPFALIDPRCEQPLAEIMLRFLGHSGSAGAKEVAQQLAVPLRTVQLALRGLVEDGACVVHKEGRRVQYVVEDTTFCAITVA